MKFSLLLKKGFGFSLRFSFNSGKYLKFSVSSSKGFGNKFNSSSSSEWENKLERLMGRLNCELLRYGVQIWEESDVLKRNMVLKL